MEVPKIVSQVVSSGELSSKSSVSSFERELLVKLGLLASHSAGGSSWPGVDDATSAGVTTVQKLVTVRPLQQT